VWAPSTIQARNGDNEPGVQQRPVDRMVLDMLARSLPNTQAAGSGAWAAAWLGFVTGEDVKLSSPSGEESGWRPGELLLVTASRVHRQGYGRLRACAKPARSPPRGVVSRRAGARWLESGEDQRFGSHELRVGGRVRPSSRRAAAGVAPDRMLNEVEVLKHRERDAPFLMVVLH
jgi:hypothetical protein